MCVLRNEGRAHTECLAREHEGIAWILLDAKAEAVIVIDPNGTIHCANESAARRFGAPVGELIGGSLWSLYPPHQVNHFRILLGEALRTGDPITVKSQNGDRWSRTLIYPVRSGEQPPSRIALCTWDDTRIVEAQERYKRTALELRAVERALENGRDLDISMPGMEGLDALKQMRTFGPRPKVGPGPYADVTSAFHGLPGLPHSLRELLRAPRDPVRRLPARGERQGKRRARDGSERRDAYPGSRGLVAVSMRTSSARPAASTWVRRW
jgi:PAS domain S-box-containing protein